MSGISSVFEKLQRRKFLKLSAVGAAGLISWKFWLKPKKQHIPKVSIKRPSLSMGHKFRDNFKFPDITKEEKVNVLIVGTGVSGLSAARRLEQAGVSGVKMIEMEPEVGGNSRSGKNEWGSYPLGAHYLPLPNPESEELVKFLQEADIITSINKEGFPEYNPYYLCHDPFERLFINGYWQEGLLPNAGVPKEDKQEIKRFKQEVEKIKFTKGKDGKWLFNLPVDLSSQDPEYLALDKVSFASWLKDRDYTSPYLIWYCNYCMRDDYGAGIEVVSAWAGLHYFCARREDGVNPKGSVLTWAEGNNFLTEKLLQGTNATVNTQEMVLSVKEMTDGVEVTSFSATENICKKYIAKEVILSTPAMITKRLLPKKNIQQPTYSPWVICTLTVKGLTQGPGAGICWDNVFYNASSLGYIHSNHQELKTYHKAINISLYWPLDSKSPSEERQYLLNDDKGYWKAKAIKELSIAHRIEEKDIIQIETWQWGHGMLRPEIGYIWGDRLQGQSATDNTAIELAHTDFGGVSVFEEAFYQGINAADNVVKKLQKQV